MTKKVLLETKETQAISKAVDLLVEHGIDLSTAIQEGGLLKQLTKRLIEKALNAEMENHLGYSKYERNDAENARNGMNFKEVITDNGAIEIEVPRDRESSFTPVLLPKRKNRLEGLDQKILSLYAKKCISLNLI